MTEAIPNGVYWVPLNPLTCRSDGYFSDENGNLVEGSNIVKADEFYKKWHPSRFLFPAKKSGIETVSHTYAELNSVIHINTGSGEKTVEAKRVLELLNESESKNARPTLDPLAELLHDAALKESARLGQLIDYMKPNPTMSYDETLSYIAKISKLTADLRYVLDGTENEMAF